MNTLIINCGSSSLKFALIAVDGNSVETRWKGSVDLIGEYQAILTSQFTHDVAEEGKHVEAKNHRDALFLLRKLLDEEERLQGVVISVVGHRVVHGGNRFRVPTLINEEMMISLKELSSLALLHNPINVLGIECALEMFPGISQYAVFDTAFHSTIGEESYRYAIPRSWYDRYNFRRYGFHGIAHGSLVHRGAKYLGIPEEQFNAITIHIGSGGSITAVLSGKSVDTSMGLTPREGLMMATRGGDMDPSIPLFVLKNSSNEIEEVERMLDNESGLFGITGKKDMKAVIESRANGDEDSSLAIKMYIHRIRKYIGSYLAILPRVDAIVFSGGVGEHSSILRTEICQGLGHLGIILDAKSNESASGDMCDISHADAKIRTLMISAGEEEEIARQIAHQSN